MRIRGPEEVSLSICRWAARQMSFPILRRRVALVWVRPGLAGLGTARMLGGPPVRDLCEGDLAI